MDCLLFILKNASFDDCPFGQIKVKFLLPVREDVVIDYIFRIDVEHNVDVRITGIRLGNVLCMHPSTK
jgi:hypothetical protein